MYKILLKVMSPMFVITQVAKVYSTYHSRGSLEVASHERREGRVHFLARLKNVYPSDLAVVNVAAHFQAQLALTGAKDVRVDIRNVATSEEGLSVELVGSFAD